MSYFSASATIVPVNSISTMNIVGGRPGVSWFSSPATHDLTVVNYIAGQPFNEVSLSTGGRRIVSLTSGGPLFVAAKDEAEATGSVEKTQLKTGAVVSIANAVVEEAALVRSASGASGGDEKKHAVLKLKTLPEQIKLIHDGLCVGDDVCSTVEGWSLPFPGGVGIVTSIDGINVQCAPRNKVAQNNASPATSTTIGVHMWTLRLANVQEMDNADQFDEKSIRLAQVQEAADSAQSTDEIVQLISVLTGKLATTPTPSSSSK
jgi:hypothetical protein